MGEGISTPAWTRGQVTYLKHSACQTLPMASSTISASGRNPPPQLQHRSEKEQGRNTNTHSNLWGSQCFFCKSKVSSARSLQQISQPPCTSPCSSVPVDLNDDLSRGWTYTRFQVSMKKINRFSNTSGFQTVGYVSCHSSWWMQCTHLCLRVYFFFLWVSAAHCPQDSYPSHPPPSPTPP